MNGRVTTSVKPLHQRQIAAGGGSKVSNKIPNNAETSGTASLPKAGASETYRSQTIHESIAAETRPQCRQILRA
jgi:hypothetical protein